VGALAALIVLGLPTLPAVGDPSMCSTTNRVVGALDTWAAVADHCPDPRVTIDGGPSGVTAADDASFTFHSPDGGTYFECSLDGAGWQGCASPQTYAGLAEGQHRFRVRAEYGWAPGDHGPVEERVWDVDTVPPETRLDSGPAATSTSRDAAFVFSSEAGASFECRLDEGAWGPCGSPRNYAGLDSHYHSFAVRARDGAGNADPTPATSDWLVQHYSPDGASDQPSISADGRYVAFRSGAVDFTAGDTNGNDDIVVYDLPDSGPPQVMEAVSVSSGGVRGNGGSSSPSISADGRYVAFRSAASNLVSGDTNEHQDIFVHDRATGATTRVSVPSAGGQADATSYSPSISGDGRYVAFSSDATNLVAADTNAREDVFVHDRAANATTRISLSSGGAQADAFSTSPSISGDGRYVAFESRASNLVSSDTNGASDVFLRDRSAAQTTRVSLTPSGAQADRSSFKPSVSGDGSRVAFESLSALHTSDTNQTSDVYVRDRGAAATTWVSAGADLSDNGRSSSPSISPSGRFVSFASEAPLSPSDANGASDVYEFDLVEGTGTHISADDFLGQRGNAASDAPSTSDAEMVAFASMASNFSACRPDHCQDNNLVEDVLIHEWVPVDEDTCETEPCTTSPAGADAAESQSSAAAPRTARPGAPPVRDSQPASTPRCWSATSARSDPRCRASRCPFLPSPGTPGPTPSPTSSRHPPTSRPAHRTTASQTTPAAGMETSITSRPTRATRGRAKTPTARQEGPGPSASKRTSSTRRGWT
jgi:Tol biopolymer transport system component